MPTTEVASERAGLATKLVQVAAAVGHVERDGTNTFHKYKYTSAEAMLTALRGPLAEHGLTLTHSLLGIEDREYTTSQGKAGVITTARFLFTFIDTDTGYGESIEWAGRGDDSADKGWGKAATNAVKTFLRAQFLIPSGDDPEADPRTDERAAHRVPAANGMRHPTPEQFDGLKAAWAANTPNDLDAAALLDELGAPTGDTPADRILSLDAKQVLDLTRRLTA